MWIQIGWLHQKPWLASSEASQSWSTLFSWARWLSGRVLDSRPRGCGLEPHTGVTVLCPWARHINPQLSTGSTQEEPSGPNWKIVDWHVKNQMKENYTVSKESIELWKSNVHNILIRANTLTHIPPHFLFWKGLLFMSAAYIQMHCRLEDMEANTMISDQTDPLGAIWSGSILQ